MDLENSFSFTCTSSICDVIKVRKKLKFAALKFEFGLDWDRETQERSPYCRVQDRILNGDFLLESHVSRGPQLVYRKGFSSPHGAICVRAGFSIKGLQDKEYNPFFGLSYNLGAGNNVAQLTDGNGVDFRTRLPLTSKFQAEICGNFKLPLPAAQFTGSGESAALLLGEGAVALNIAQINPLIYI